MHFVRMSGSTLDYNGTTFFKTLVVLKQYKVTITLKNNTLAHKKTHPEG